MAHGAGKQRLKQMLAGWDKCPAKWESDVSLSYEWESKQCVFTWFGFCICFCLYFLMTCFLFSVVWLFWVGFECQKIGPMKKNVGFEAFSMQNVKKILLGNHSS